MRRLIFPKTTCKLFKSQAISIFLLCVLVVITLLTFKNSLQNQLAYDDDLQISNNPWITHIQYIPTILSSDVWGFYEFHDGSQVYYRPLMHLVFLLEYKFFHLKITHWHAVNIFFHTANTCLAFILFKKILTLSRPFSKTKNYILSQKNILVMAFLSALIFSIHPINAQVVNWISAIPELCYTFFILLSTTFYIKNTNHTNRSISLLFFIIALLFKESALMFLLALYLLHICTSQREVSLAIKTILWIKKDIAFIVLALLYFLGRSYALDPPSHQGFLDIVVNIPINILSMLIEGPVILYRYISHFLHFSNLNIHYFYSLNESFVLPSIIFYGLISFLILYTITYKHTFHHATPLPITIGTLFMLIFLMPALSPQLVGICILSDRYFYLPSIGLSLITSYILISLIHLVRNRRTKTSLLIMLTISMAYLSIYTHTNNNIWYNTTTLFTHSVEKEVDFIFTRMKLLSNLSLQGDLENYRKFSDHALIAKNMHDPEHNVYFSQLWYDHAYINLISGDKNQAIRSYEKILIKDTTSKNFASRVYRDLGILHYSLGNNHISKASFSKALMINKDSQSTYRALAITQCANKDMAGANENFDLALKHGDLNERIRFTKEICAHSPALETFKRSNLFPQL